MKTPSSELEKIEDLFEIKRNKRKGLLIRAQESLAKKNKAQKFENSEDMVSECCSLLKDDDYASLGGYFVKIQAPMVRYSRFVPREE